MSAKIPGTRKRFSTRRKALFGLVAVLLLVVGWLQYVGAAGISGMPTKEMDWNADGTVSQQEILQAFYAVGVAKTSEGRRECSEYRWRKDDRSIRVDCRTTMATEPAKK
ncbi:MAG: EF-hand domain-containing protein [Pseudoxanthomonas sp.]